MTSVQAGEVEAVHASTIANLHRQQLVDVEGQSDVVIFGLPHIGPYNVGSIMNPLLVMCLSLGYFFNFYMGKPLVRPGGVVIVSHPTPWASTPFTTPPISISSTRCFPSPPTRWRSKRLRGALRHRRVVPPPVPDELRLPRRTPAVHVVLGSPRPRVRGGTIIVGGNRRAVRRMGFKPATTLADALEMAEDQVGRDPTITYFRCPPVMLANVH